MKSLASTAIVALAMVTLPCRAAGYIAVDAVVTAVHNTSSNVKNFAVTVAGGTGSCTGRTIVFPEADASGIPAHQRAYASALLALTTGMKATIYNYVDDTCDRASYIQLVK